MYQPYTVFRRKTRNKKRYIYYVQFRDADAKRMTAVSSGKSTKGEALAWANEQYQVGFSRKKRCPRFGEYAAPWFLWDRCEYLARKRERGDYSRSYAEYQRSRLTNHLLPFFSQKRLDEISVADIERWLIQRKQQSSPANANRALVVLKVMLKEAVRQGLTSVSPAELVEGLPEVSAQKGTLSVAEVSSMFDPDMLEGAWRGNPFYRALNAIALTTGMRMGEIQALRWEDVRLDHICVEHSWDRRYGLKAPKANSRRFVPLAVTVATWLEELRADDDQIDAKTLVFHGVNLYRPIDHKAIGRHFHRALEAIGISADQQHARNITFHSWRHTFHVLMRGRMSDVDLRRITGHRTARMTEHYDHVTIDLVRQVSPIIEQVLTLPEACSPMSTGSEPPGQNYD